MSIVLDIILVVIFALFVFTSIKKGFVLSLLEFVAVIMAFVLSYSISPAVAQAAYDGFVEEKIVESVEAQIDENFSLAETAEQTEVLLDAIPDFMVSYAESTGVSIDDVKEKIASEKFSSENIATELVEKVAQPIVVGALTAVFFLIISVALIFILKIAAQLISKVFKLPLLNTVNKALGGILGGLKGFVVVIFICSILTIFFSSGDNEIADAVKDSMVINTLDEINPFIKSLKDIF